MCRRACMESVFHSTIILVARLHAVFPGRLAKPCTPSGPDPSKSCLDVKSFIFWLIFWAKQESIHLPQH